MLQLLASVSIMMGLYSETLVGTGEVDEDGGVVMAIDHQMVCRSIVIVRKSFGGRNLQRRGGRLVAIGKRGEERDRL